MLIALAAYSGALGALATIGRKPRLTGGYYGIAVAGCLLGAGISPTLPYSRLPRLPGGYRQTVRKRCTHWRSAWG
jgi:hypothetical protein